MVHNQIDHGSLQVREHRTTPPEGPVIAEHSLRETIMQIDRGRVAAAVARLFDAASSAEAGSLNGLLTCLQRIRGRTILIDHGASLPTGVMGRWVALETKDLIQLQHDGPGPNWTMMHEVGHIVLGHAGRHLDRNEGDERPSALDHPGLITGRPHDPTLDREEAEAEAFAGLLGQRLRQAARSTAPVVQARLDETLG